MRGKRQVADFTYAKGGKAVGLLRRREHARFADKGGLDVEEAVGTCAHKTCFASVVGRRRRVSSVDVVNGRETRTEGEEEESEREKSAPDRFREVAELGDVLRHEGGELRLLSSKDGREGCYRGIGRSRERVDQEGGGWRW